MPVVSTDYFFKYEVIPCSYWVKIDEKSGVTSTFCKYELDLFERFQFGII